jgi:hypothetical protein
MAKNVPNGQKCTKWPKMYQMTVIDIFQIAREYTNLFHSKALQNLPKLGFFGLKINHLATLQQTGNFGSSELANL